MFKNLKTLKKATLQELQNEFDLKMLHLGNLTYQVTHIEKARQRTLQELESLAKRGQSTKEKIEADLKQKIAQGEKTKNENKEMDQTA